MAGGKLRWWCCLVHTVFCVVYSVQYNDSDLTEGHKVSNYSSITYQLDTDSSSFLSDILLTCPASSQSTHAISLLSQLRAGAIIHFLYSKWAQTAGSSKLTNVTMRVYHIS